MSIEPVKVTVERGRNARKRGEPRTDSKTLHEFCREDWLKGWDFQDVIECQLVNAPKPQDLPKTDGMPMSLDDKINLVNGKVVEKGKPVAGYQEPKP